MEQTWTCLCGEGNIDFDELACEKCGGAKFKYIQKSLIDEGYKPQYVEFLSMAEAYIQNDIMLSREWINLQVCCDALGWPLVCLVRQFFFLSRGSIGATSSATTTS